MDHDLASIIGRRHAAQVGIAGEVAYAFFDRASPRHALEHPASRLGMCVSIVLACRDGGCIDRAHERGVARALLAVLERVYEEVRELEVIDLFQDAAAVVRRIRERLAAFFYQLRYGRPHGAAYSFSGCFLAYSASASVGSKARATELTQ